VLAAWAAALALALGARAAALHRERAWVTLALALLGWTLLSTLWSPEQAQSLLEARRTVVYAAVVLALVVLARRGSALILVAATQLAIALLVLYALVRYLVEPRPFDSLEGNLLAQPLGYANAVGILAALGLLLSLGMLVEKRHVAVRTASAAAVPPLAVALELTGSHASWLALAAGGLTLVLLHPVSTLRLRPMLAVATATVAAVAVAYESRLSAGVPSPRFGSLYVGCAALAAAALAAAAVVLVRDGSVRPRRGRRKAAAILAVVVVVGGGFTVARAGSTEPRSSYYHVAWREYRAHPLLGSGAGTFGRYWLHLGSPARFGGALDAHSLYLETLAELGPLGLLLLGGFLLAPLRHALTHRASPGVPAATGAMIAFLVHAGLDWDWEMPAVVVAALACSAVVTLGEPGAVPEEHPPSSRRGRTAALVCALLLGAAALAGARSTTEPSAALHTTEAPQSGASVVLIRQVQAAR
jgi:O-Antigen ligase